MARRVLPATFLLALALAGCSMYPSAQRPAWRRQAENACMAQGLVRPTAYQQLVREIEGPGICGLTQPLRVTALSDGNVSLSSAATLDCSMTAELESWLRDVVQPAARARFGADVARINSMGAYSCRGMNNQAGASLSEHAFGNAIDIGGFALSDGRSISVRSDWSGGDEATRGFLRDVQGGACEHFTTVLAPGSNAFHYDHIHLDLAMHGGTSRGPRRICKPAPLQMAPTPPRDSLPDAPELDEETDVARAPPDPRRTYAGAGASSFGSAMSGALPPPAPARLTAMPVARPAAFSRARGRDDEPFVPEGNPRDWDTTSSIRKR